MEVSGQLHTPAALPPGKSTAVLIAIGGWVEPIVGLDVMEKRTIFPLLESISGRPAHSPSLYRLRNSGSVQDQVFNNLLVFLSSTKITLDDPDRDIKSQVLTKNIRVH
jgi:hypothetical protein